MQYRQLGRTDLKVSLLGLGSGGANRLGQSQQMDRQDAVRFVRYALDAGINTFDTAPGYGESEEWLGEALVGVPREAYVLSTKVTPSVDAAGLTASLDHSLSRLKTDYVDVFFLHGLMPGDITATMDRLLPALQEAKRSGKIRHYGMTEMYERDESHEALQRALREDLFDVIMIGHNLISPSGLVSVMPLAEEKNVGVMVMCAVRSIISNPERLRAHIREWKEAGALAVDAVPDDAPLDWVLGRGAETLTDAAYKFAAESPAVSTVLSGTVNTGHLDANVRAILGAPLPAEISQRLRDLFIPVNRSVLLHRFAHR